jgi:hemerythrin superfamily protein
VEAPGDSVKWIIGSPPRLGRRNADSAGVVARRCALRRTAAQPSAQTPRFAVVLLQDEASALRMMRAFVQEGETMPNSRGQKDACDLLDADHRAVKKMFKEYEELTNSRARNTAQKKMDLARQICHELTVHAQIEEDIFYPALRAALKETDLVAEAEVEHQSAKDLIAQIESMGEADEMFDAKVTVLGEYIDHHVKEERNEMFPKARSNRKLDLVAMRDELQARKEELMGEMA